ncbi:HK97 gp10 family phage protein [Stappia sp. F7233]|uniref:HK97 gp10 family phage protein n=1 Tax=Stappia albiluteola TaxID=2758565 RepID=A0A839AKG1_9HYPH|nr:HK97-gp10 family putative phage morphogenesis protein [Stappia albiluteola]MBA5779494.1 HK97 gp10 family phage protein [Stappia albiluteola]
MADGVSLKTRSVDRSLARLRRVVPELDAEINKANEASANEMADLARRLAPKRSGDYAASINAKKVEDGQATFVNTSRTPRGVSTTSRTISATAAWGIFASWIWTFLEFGTRNASAQPHIFPAYRLIRRRHLRRARRALSVAVRKALAK